MIKILIIILLFFASCTTYKLKKKYDNEFKVCINLLDYYNYNQTIKDSSIFEVNELSEFKDIMWVDTNKFLINNNYKLIDAREDYINLGGSFFLENKGINSSSLFHKLLVFQFQVCENEKKCNVIEFKFKSMYNKYKLINIQVNPDIESKYIKPKIIYDYNSDLP